jgi:hypothetical protein
MAHPRDEREWRKEVERRLQQQGSAVSRVAGQIVPVIDGVVNGIIGKQPTAPIELVAQTSIYMNTKGVWRGRFTLDFPDVTVATDGSPVTIAWYELQGSRGGVYWPAQNESAPSTVTGPRAAAKMHAPMIRVGGARTVSAVAMKGSSKAKAPVVRSWDNSAGFTTLATSPTSSLRIDDLDPGAFYTFRARAMGANSVTPGEWSDEVEVTILHDTLPPPQMTKPVATVTRGTITVTWDGKSVSGQMPGDFLYAELAHGTDANPTEIVARFYGEGGFTVISDVPYYDPQFFRIRGVDESGNVGPWSQQEVAYVTPLVDEDIILSAIDAAKTLLINVDAGVSILSDTILTRHLVITEDMTVALLAAHQIVAGDIAANAIEADKIDAGAVTAEKLEAELALLTKIIAGDPTGTHAQMDPDGFRVFANDEVDGIPNEVVRMGVASTGDYFAITRGDNTLAATISQDGIGSFDEVNANALYYKGSELTDILLRLPQGVVARGAHDFGGWGASNNLLIGSNSYYGIMSAGWNALPRRTYKVSFKTPMWAASTAGEIQFAFMLRVVNQGDTSLPTMANSGTWQHIIRTYSSVGSWEAETIESHINTAEDLIGKQVQVIIAAWHGPAGNTGFVRLFLGSELIVEDVGDWDKASPAYHSSGGGAQFDGDPVPPPPTTQTYTSQWGAYDSRSYTGGNAFYNYNVGQMYQGLSPAGYGNLKSIAVFPDMTGALAGATIHYVRVYFNFNHWYYNSGGTARIGVHGHTGLPGTFGSVGPMTAFSGGWPKPGARWVELSPGHFDGFRTGQWRGVYLEGDGGYGTYGYADRPTIEIRYTK